MRNNFKVKDLALTLKKVTVYNIVYEGIVFPCWDNRNNKESDYSVIIYNLNGEIEEIDIRSISDIKDLILTDNESIKKVDELIKILKEKRELRFQMANLHEEFEDMQSLAQDKLKELVSLQNLMSKEDFVKEIKKNIKDANGYELYATVFNGYIQKLKFEKEVFLGRNIKEDLYDFLEDSFLGDLDVIDDLTKSKDLNKLKTKHFKDIKIKLDEVNISDEVDISINDKNSVSTYHIFTLNLNNLYKLKEENINKIRDIVDITIKSMT